MSSLVERVGRMREAGDRLGAGEEPRHAALLARPVRLAALVDQGLRAGVGDDPASAEGARAERPDGVVVGQDEVAEGQVADAARMTSIHCWAMNGVARASMARIASVPTMQPTFGSPCAV